jgi:glucose/arabinose dehydrogenase
MTGRMLRCLVLSGLMLAAMAETGRAAVPAGFSDTLVTSVGSPTALAFTPDGRMLITTQGGTLRVWAGTLLPTPALTLSLCTGSERGLLGVAVDPGFATNRRIYLFYTASTCVNRVSRFTFSSTPGQENMVDPASELILVNNMPSPAGNHNAGDVQIGKDGNLYISIGDGGCDYANDSGCAGSNDASRDQQTLTGKILRITLDGNIPSGNPFTGAGTERCNMNGTATIPSNKCQETFAWGFRNPFRFAMDPNAVGTRVFVNDVGQGAWEEIDEVQAGADYGWNCREGAHTNSTTGRCSPTPPAMIDPIFEYPHGTPGPAGINNCNSITGGAFVPNGLWPGFNSSYLFSDFICGAIFKLTQSGTWSATTFATSLGGSSAVHLLFGPWGTTQALYYTTFAGGGQVRRISLRIPRPGGPLDYHTVPPCRVADTRSAFGMQGGPALAFGATRTFQVAGLCGVPSTASAVELDVTVVSPSTSGNLQIEQGDGPASGLGVVNFNAGVTRTNNAVVSLGTAGDVAVTAAIPSGTVHVAIDVMGYFE